MIGFVDKGVNSILNAMGLSSVSLGLGAAIMNRSRGMSQELTKAEIRDLYADAMRRSMAQKKAKAQKHETPQKIRHNAGVSAAESYLNKRNMSPAKASTLKKTARAYRIAGKALSH